MPEEGQEFRPLLSVLEFELKRGCANKAVIGGLDKYISNWSAESLKKPGSASSRDTILEIVGKSRLYEGWDIKDRKAWLEGLISWIKKSCANTPVAAAPAIKPSPAVKKQAPPRPSSTPEKAATLPPPTPFSRLSLDSDVTEIKGVKAYLAEKLEKVGARKIRDLLYLFPRYHLDYSKKTNIADLPIYAMENEEMGPATVVVNVWESNVLALGGRGMKATQVVFGDDTGNASAIWFNQPYLAKQFQVDSRIIISGKYKVVHGNITFQSPDWDMPDEDKGSVHAGRLVPVYPLTAGLYQRQLRNLIKRTMDIWAGKVIDFMPPEIKKKCGLVDLPVAIRQAHFPESTESNERAKKRLAFDELFIIQMGMLRKKQDWKNENTARSLKLDGKVLDSLLKCLPYKLTNAQEGSLKDILADLGSHTAMSRLLQGDVGSGKTIVALIAILAAVNSGHQSAFMAPTEILAEQHFNNISQILATMADKSASNGFINSYEGIFAQPVSIALLTGKISEKEKVPVYKGLAEGSIQIAVGTHALIQKGVSFNRLGLVVIDEQHRFGVLQRNELRQKGFNPHVLVMTATPIPRTLALTLYGDLDISVINELPPGRQIIRTRWLMPEQREKAYGFIRKEVQAGHQAFIICPLIEESESIEAKAAVAEFERLSREVFQDLRMGLLHGRMKPGQKDQIMADFRRNSFDILVSTPVVEVGIDIPNATVILIEAANRFGLSQLHQFRGRVGRGKDQSYCILLSDAASLEARERLKIIENTQDGFVLAEKDLEIRGPGEFFGTRQSGLPDLRMAKLTDVVLLESARREAQLLFNEDPLLRRPENRLLAIEMGRVWPSIEWS
jgi:ATP-dependent DNA helicase RecG